MRFTTYKIVAALTGFVLLCLIAMNACAQSYLPACKGDTSSFNNCFGADTYSSGSKYEGEFKDGKPNGRGTATLANGDKHEGEWKEGKANGHGKLTKANGIVYVGGFKENLYEGQGSFTFVDGDKFTGEFKEGEANGQATYTAASGQKYVGGWKNDKPNGEGIEYKADGTVSQSGVWDGGKLVKALTLETKRFPFNSSPLVVSTDVQLTDPVKAEPNSLSGSLAVAQLKCEELGFKPKTEGFGKCVLQLSK